MRARIPSLCFLSIVAGLTLAAVSLRAEHEGVQPAAGSTRLIVRAINSDGQPVLDLKPADISIKTDGEFF